MTDAIKIKVKRLSEDFSDVALPYYATPGSAGMDIRATLKEDITLEPGKVELVSTNISVEIPLGYEIQVRPRSGLAANHSIGILNSPGTIDSDYRGEVKIILMNFGKENFKISNGDRIAQLIVSKVYNAKMVEVQDLNSSSRGKGGFGHTGKK
ncbi:MAG: dUTP diphosphatase [Ignavibacteriales bacterium]|nr:dUTP diphosphatase [Ignavibacteriales bacterium]